MIKIWNFVWILRYCWYESFINSSCFVSSDFFQAPQLKTSKLSNLQECFLEVIWYIYEKYQLRKNRKMICLYSKCHRALFQFLRMNLHSIYYWWWAHWCFLVFNNQQVGTETPRRCKINIFISIPSGLVLLDS